MYTEKDMQTSKITGFGDGDATVSLNAVGTHTTVSMVTYKQPHRQFRLGKYNASAGSSRKLIMEGSPCGSMAVYAAATLADLALPSTLAAVHVGRAIDDKRNKSLCNSI